MARRPLDFRWCEHPVQEARARSRAGHATARKRRLDRAFCAERRTKPAAGHNPPGTTP